MPGNANTLFIWLGKSLRPVPTIAAPASFARSGIISGTGFAIASIIRSGAIERTISGVTHPGAETPINTSAPRIAIGKRAAHIGGIGYGRHFPFSGERVFPVAA